jgi:hypothetical protein
MSKEIILPSAPKCPKGTLCSGSVTIDNPLQTHIYIPECLYAGNPGVLNRYAIYRCPACRTEIKFRWNGDDKEWEFV